MDLNIVWYVLIGMLITGYAVLDGFDLGVGALHLFARSDQDRRTLLNAIGPVWDGNEVWLVTGGGALFAVFPHVYATVFSGFYTAFMLLLFALIFRSVAIEFRSRLSTGWWRNLWDVGFSLSSILSSLLIGIAFGNIVWGIPLGPDKEFTGTFLSLLNPYSLMIGVLTLSLFMMHGSIYLAMKTEGVLREQVLVWEQWSLVFFFICYTATSVATFLFVPRMVNVVTENWVFFIIPFVTLLAIANIIRSNRQQKDFQAFLSSAVTIVSLMALVGIHMFPNLVFSNSFAEYSLTIYNAASSQKTLTIMLIIAAIGMPLVLAYTVCIYWTFRGKVKLEDTSY